jgi:hypothetical protein
MSCHCRDYPLRERLNASPPGSSRTYYRAPGPMFLNETAELKRRRGGVAIGPRSGAFKGNASKETARTRLAENLGAQVGIGVC